MKCILLIANDQVAIPVKFITIAANFGVKLDIVSKYHVEHQVASDDLFPEYVVAYCNENAHRYSWIVTFDDQLFRILQSEPFRSTLRFTLIPFLSEADLELERHFTGLNEAISFPFLMGKGHASLAHDSEFPIFVKLLNPEGTDATRVVQAHKSPHEPLFVGGEKVLRITELMPGVVLNIGVVVTEGGVCIYFFSDLLYGEANSTRAEPPIPDLTYIRKIAIQNIFRGASFCGLANIQFRYDTKSDVLQLVDIDASVDTAVRLFTFFLRD
jgi:hypothetical protein